MEELNKSINCLEQITDDKMMKVEGAQMRITVAKPVIERLAEDTLTAEEGLELLKAQKQHDSATKFIEAEQPLIAKLEKGF